MKEDRVIADQVLQDIADYVIDYKVESEEALDTARNCLSLIHISEPTRPY